MARFFSRLQRVLRTACLIPFTSVLCFATGAVAAPRVEGIELVQSVRVSRTVFDYSYRLRLQGDADNYSAGTVAVATRSAIAGASITKGAVATGRIDTGSFIRTADVFTVRQDRTTPFDASQFTFAFTGTKVLPPADANGLSFGSVKFAEDRGRPGHEATLPIQGSDPEAGKTVVLLANIFGAPNTANYRLVSPSGALISEGVLNTLTTPDEYYAGILVPSQPFQLEIRARSVSGVEVVWRSPKTYGPAPFRVAVAPLRAVVSKGETTPLDIAVVSSTASGAFRITLTPPPGFNAPTLAWTINLTPGSSQTISTSITAPSSGGDFKRHTLVVSVVGENPSDPTREYFQRMLVR